MFVLQPGTTQYCAHQTHDGIPKGRPGGPAGPTRKLWPTGHLSFDAAKAAYTVSTTKAAAEPSALPELDITLEV